MLARVKVARVPAAFRATVPTGFTPGVAVVTVKEAAPVSGPTGMLNWAETSDR